MPCVLQATALAFGSNHSAILMLPGKDNKAGHHSLYTMGRGEALPEQHLLIYIVVKLAVTASTTVQFWRSR